MARKFLLSYRQPERRWRKRYRGKYHYFPLLDDETKLSSYQRVLREWTQLKARLDLDTEGKAEAKKAWAPILNAVRESQDRIITLFGDTEKTRKIWLELEETFVKRIIEPAIRDGATPNNPDSFNMLVEGQTESLQSAFWQPTKVFGKSLGMTPEDAIGVPPWEQDPEVITSVQQLAAKFVESVRSDSSARRAGDVRKHVNDFLATLPDDTSIEVAFSGATLDSYLRDVRSRSIKPKTMSHKVSTVKQFAVWAFHREYIDSIPRLIDAKKFKVEVPVGEIDLYEDDEVKSILAAATGRAKLYVLLALNCGFTQADIADLHPSEVDLENGIITRKRSKTAGHDSVPEVSRQLWDETAELLREHVSTSDPERILVNTQGKPLVEVRDGKEGKFLRTDAVAKVMDRLKIKMERKKSISFKMFRATAASKLGEHGEYRAYAQYFLGHSPSSIADRHYIKPSQARFDEAVEWLRGQFAD